MTRASLWLYMDLQPVTLTRQGNRDASLIKKILNFFFKIQTSKQTLLKVSQKPFRNSLKFTGVCPLQSHTEKSELRDNNTTRSLQEALCPDDHTVFRFLQENVFLLSFHPLPPPPTSPPLRRKTTKTNEFGLFKKKCQTSPTTEQRIRRGVRVSCSPPAEALTSRGFSRASRGARKTMTNPETVLVLMGTESTQV